MARTTRKPAPTQLGTIWTPIASIWVIDMKSDPPRRRILATCTDTPNAIRAKLRELWSQGYRSLWSTGGVSEKKYHGSGD